MIAGNIPGKTQTIPLGVYYNVESGNMSGAWILAAISFIVSLIVIQTVTRLESSH